MSKIASAGLLMYRNGENGLEVFLCYPGGPYVKNNDYWMLPKGTVEKGEKLLDAAIREFKEETGFKVNAKKFLFLGEILQNKKKVVSIWAFYNPEDPPAVKSINCKVEYPAKSGKFIECPEVADGKYFKEKQARKVIRPKQAVFIDRLAYLLDSGDKKAPENWKLETKT